MDAEQHSRAPDGHRDRYRGPAERGADPRGAAHAEHQGHRQVGGRRGGRVTAREGRPREDRAWTQLRPGSVDGDLDRVRDQHLAEDDRRHEQRDRGLPPSPQAVQGDRDPDAQDRGRVAEVRDDAEHGIGERRRVLVRPDLDRMVEVDEPDVAPDHPGEDADDHAGDDEGGQRHGERQTRGRRRIHP
jgi:hypothetical protein